ncbi:hypothetical protein PoB_002070300 [Plakobranchus ocellatus]|uniref:Uncharacterized protein n=1 Tax=Plakobranchus ocellatus TaxID=259542 RepID=A0AAV3ZI41_9GAST|nr:hypothetical protein PoB_002070300 [Plakobranchus ocellatus]
MLWPLVSLVGDIGYDGTGAPAFDIPGGGYWRRRIRALAFCIAGGEYWRQRAGALASDIPGGDIGKNDHGKSNMV